MKADFAGDCCCLTLQASTASSNKLKSLRGKQAFHAMRKSSSLGFGPIDFQNEQATEPLALASRCDRSMIAAAELRSPICDLHDLSALARRLQVLLLF